MKNLISTSWLYENLARDDLVILDCSVSVAKDDDGQTSYASGVSEFESGHIPTAQHADLWGALSDAKSPHLFALPTVDAFAASVAALGVSNGSTVVVYDRSFTAWAARVWWMLRWIGVDNALILDGGLNAWTAAGHSLSTGQASMKNGMLSPSARFGVIAQQQDVRSAQADGSAQLIDTLPQDVFNGITCDYARPVISRVQPIPLHLICLKRMGLSCQRKHWKGCFPVIAPLRKSPIAAPVYWPA